MSLLSIVKDHISACVDLLYPRACPVCRASLNRSDAAVCGKCLENITFFCGPLCSRCGRPLASDIPQSDGCGSCRAEQHACDRVIALGKYEGMLKECIHAFKFGKKEYLGEWFADTMVSALDGRGVDLRRYDLIVPVPMHPAKRRERGFNQAEALARSLGRRLDIPWRADTLRKAARGMVQSRLSKKDRLLNVEGVFRIRRRNFTRGKRLILVDDIYTTGATADACAAVLKNDGAQEVATVVIARGVQDFTV